MDFRVYELKAQAVHFGERAKGNLFKPCLRTIPYSAITGALNRRFGPFSGRDGLKAAGYLVKAIGKNRAALMAYSPRDRVAGASKIPLQVEFLADVLGTVLVPENDAAICLPNEFAIALGGMRSRGFGEAQLRLVERRAAGNPRRGALRLRLPEQEASAFGLRKVLAATYGYLFAPTPGTQTGVYVRSLFEGSRVVAPEPLLEAGRE